MCLILDALWLALSINLRIYIKVWLFTYFIYGPFYDYYVIVKKYKLQKNHLLFWIAVYFGYGLLKDSFFLYKKKKKGTFELGTIIF